jgi:hypothetical protein
MVTTTSGGKGPGATRAVGVLQPRQPLFKESLSPPADNLPSSIQAFGNLIIAETFGGEQNHFRSKHLKIRQRIFCRS